MEKFNIEKVASHELEFEDRGLTFSKDIAAYVKQEFDRRFGTTWHVIVGRNFGSYVTHETRHFIYFYLGQIAFLIFKYVPGHRPSDLQG